MKPYDMSKLQWRTCYRHDKLVGELCGEYDVIDGGAVQLGRAQIQEFDADSLSALKNLDLSQAGTSITEEDAQFVSLQKWAVLEANKTGKQLHQIFKDIAIVANSNLIARIADAQVVSDSFQFIACKIGDTVFLKEEATEHDKKEIENRKERLCQLEAVRIGIVSAKQEKQDSALPRHHLVTKFSVSSSGSVNIACITEVGGIDTGGEYVIWETLPNSLKDRFPAGITFSLWLKLAIIGRQAKAGVVCHNEQHKVEQVVLARCDHKDGTQWLLPSHCGEHLQGLAAMLHKLIECFDAVPEAFIRVHNGSAGKIVHFEKLHEKPTNFFTDEFKQRFDIVH